MSRIFNHPVLEIQSRQSFEICVDGISVIAYEGETIAATLLANGIRAFRRTRKFNEPRGVFCGIGHCADCILEVDSIPNVRACITIVHPGMIVNTQKE